jgi:hypothetical protein
MLLPKPSVSPTESPAGALSTTVSLVACSTTWIVSPWPWWDGVASALETATTASIASAAIAAPNSVLRILVSLPTGLRGCECRRPRRGLSSGARGLRAGA